MDIKRLSVALVSGMGFFGAYAQAEPFVFQGQLNDAGAPATGIYDLVFDLFAVDSGGTAIAGTVVLEDQQVTQGTFAVELDFGDAFDGSQRWIQIGVRAGDDVGNYTTLSPRAKVGNSPQASYASNAGVAAVADALADPFWTQAPGILVFGENEGNDRFFFNRDRDVDPTDIMVIHSAQNGLGGLTISSWANGMPYYGYATGGFMRAKTYYDPVSDAWIVNKNGDQLEIDQNNDVIITNNLIVGGTVTALGGTGETTIGYTSYTPESLFIGLSNSNTLFNSFAGAVVAQGSPLYLRAGLDLPHGSSITKIEIVYVDQQVSPNLRVELFTRDLASMAFTATLLGESSGSAIGFTQTMVIEPSTPILIDNTLQTYNLRMIPSTGIWPSVGNLGVRSVLVEYTLP